jgi:hypothetical protein
LKAKSGGRRAELIFQVLNKVSGGEPWNPYSTLLLSLVLFISRNLSTNTAQSQQL